MEEYFIILSAFCRGYGTIPHQLEEGVGIFIIQQIIFNEL